jgi:hypothetical protein
MAATKASKNADPVLPDQSGRLMLVDPFGTNAPEDETVRRRAYEIYEQSGREDGHDLEHWLKAECEVR